METHDSIARSSASLRTMATNFRCSMDLLAGQSVPLLDMLRLPNKRVIACIGDGSFQVRDKFHTNLLTHLCWSEVGIGKEWVGQVPLPVYPVSAVSIKQNFQTFSCTCFGDLWGSSS
ncbi:hypothetical protein I3843_09G067400 [Carya illinoinensis]|uniref:Uncharacterized protein n=1 Tax=Carya illinoinensis TaxID=32201 RepID=A0A922E2A2_CARIL|nr:hypothetical protein I3760_09G067000 [Carya illinoinensis]KAG6694812.1 hypothetical protein I3842_09G067300 [Carya illinoinensis]KAG7962446.1 hypothetical protein I3843_09G067400 [Carya illinoinensis]